MKTAQLTPRRIVLSLCGIAAVLLLLLLVRPALATTALGLLLVLPVGILARGRDAKDEWEQQAAFEEAERKRAEARAAAVFDSFVDSSPVPVEVFAGDGTPLRSNRAAERLLGKIPPPGIPLFDERGLKRAGLLEPQLKRVLAGTRVETPPTWYDPTEIGLPGTPGERVCFRATVFPLFDSEGTIARIAVIHEDLTEAKKLEEERRSAPTDTEKPQAAAASNLPQDIRDLEFKKRKIEHALRESEQRFRSFVEGARGFAILRSDENGRVLAVSPSIEETWGISADTIITDPSALLSRVHPDDLDMVSRTETEMRGSGTFPSNYRFRVINRKTEQVHWVEARGSVGVSMGRRTFDRIILDVTAEQEAEQLLAEKTASLESILKSEVDGVVALDEELNVLHWNKAAREATGIPESNAKGHAITELYPDFEKSGYLAPVLHTIATGQPQKHEAFYHDGREEHAGWFRISSYPFRGKGVLLLIRNISGLRRTELALRTTENRLKSLLDSPGLALAIKDRESRFVLANGTALRMLGSKSESQVVGKTVGDVLKPSVAELLRSNDERVLASAKPEHLEIALPDAVSRNSAWYRMTTSPVLDADGDMVGLLCVAFDISRQVFLRQELARWRVHLEKLLKTKTDTT